MPGLIILILRYKPIEWRKILGHEEGVEVLDAVLLAHTRKDRLEGLGSSLAVGELHAVVRQDGVDLIGHGAGSSRSDYALRQRSSSRCLLDLPI
jgi:hypothetical protein